MARQEGLHFAQIPRVVDADRPRTADVLYPDEEVSAVAGVPDNLALAVARVVVVATQGGKESSLLHVPETNDLIAPRRGDDIAPRAEIDAVDPGRKALGVDHQLGSGLSGRGLVVPSDEHGSGLSAGGRHHHRSDQRDDDRPRWRWHSNGSPVDAWHPSHGTIPRSSIVCRPLASLASPSTGPLVRAPRRDRGATPPIGPGGQGHLLEFSSGLRLFLLS